MRRMRFARSTGLVSRVDPCNVATALITIRPSLALQIGHHNLDIVVNTEG